MDVRTPMNLKSVVVPATAMLADVPANIDRQFGFVTLGAAEGAVAIFPLSSTARILAVEIHGTFTNATAAMGYVNPGGAGGLLYSSGLTSAYADLNNPNGSSYTSIVLGSKNGKSFAFWGNGATAGVTADYSVRTQRATAVVVTGGAAAQELNFVKFWYAE